MIGMAVRIRDFDHERDAKPVAEFFNRQGYGPVGVGLPLTEESLLRVLAERDVRRLLLAEQAGQLVGTIAYARVSGRRVAGEDELFAGMFLIAPSHRSGFLAGRLFAESFSRLLSMGIRSLRVEVDPSNKRAFPLYVRVGFRAVAGLRPDEDGYVELISLLPAVTSDLLAAFSDHRGVTELLPKMDWRTLSASRQGITSGIRRDADGGLTLEYEFQIGKHRVIAVADAAERKVVSVTVDGVEDSRFAPTRTTVATPAAPQERRAGAFSVSIDRRGTLIVSHPRHRGAVHRETFPVDHTMPLGARRPLSSPVSTMVTPEGWISERGDVRREVTVHEGRILVRISNSRARQARVLFTPGLRVAEIVINGRDTQPQSGHPIRGRWPLDLTDFEASAEDVSADGLLGASISWRDSGSGLQARVEFAQEERLRFEGPAVLLAAGDAQCTYSIVLEDLPPRSQVRARTPSATATRWREAKRGGHPVLVAETTETSITVAPDHGLVHWCFQDRVLLEGSFPVARTLGPLGDVTAAMWAGFLSDRSDADHGVGWPLADDRLPFTTGRAAGWSVVPLVDGSLAVAARVGETPPASELAICLLVRGPSVHVELEDTDGAMIGVAPDNRPWRSWTRRARIAVGGGRNIQVTPLEGEQPEIFVRSTSSGVLLTLLTTAVRDGRSLWRLAPSEAAKE